MTKDAAARTYDLDWRFEPRLTTDHLGRHKYTTSTKAIGELIANAFDAGATLVDVQVIRNQLGGVQAITIADDGRGITPQELQRRFVVVGVETEQSAQSPLHLGRFGVGRLAVHRIGSLSHWTTVAIVADARVQSQFTLSSAGEKALRITETGVPDSTPLGTRIEIHNIHDNSADSLSPTRFQYDLVAQFCAYLLANPARKIRVEGTDLAVESLIESRESESPPPPESVPTPIRLDHLLLRRPLDLGRFPGQLLFTAKGRTIAAVQPEDPPTPNYLGLVDCPYLDSIVSSNRESVIELDGGFADLKKIALERVRHFGIKYEAARKSQFIEHAREEDYYPYKSPPTDAVTIVEQQMYDVVLGEVDKHANVQGMTGRQKEVVFRLLHRSMQNQNLLEILHEVAKLSDADMEKFRKVLERTTLDSLIKLASEVTSRLAFLDYLHELCYGNLAHRVKERTQLHRVIEPNCWIFGPKFHLATSDQSFREVIRKHRRMANLEDADEDRLYEIASYDDIPDLFLAATRDYPISPKHHHVLVELKAPKVALRQKELQQVRRYAQTINDSHELNKTETQWDLFLVSGKAGKEVEMDRKQKDRPHGLVQEWSNTRIWAVEWCEVITRAKEEMQLVRDHLALRSQELTVSDYLRENFPEILEGLEARSSPKPSDSGGVDPVAASGSNGFKGRRKKSTKAAKAG